MSSIQDIATGVGRGESSYAMYVGDSSSILNMLIYTLPRFAYFLFSPFPWQWRGLSDIIAACFNSSFYFWITFRTVQYFRSKSQNNKAIVISLIVITICSLFIFAWGVSNTGTAIRHKDKIIILFILLWACTSKNDVITPCTFENKTAGNYSRRHGVNCEKTIGKEYTNNFYNIGELRALCEKYKCRTLFYEDTILDN